MKKLSLPPTERRRLTRNQIYQYIYKAPGCSKQEIADSLNFSMPTVHQNLNELTQAGLVRSMALENLRVGAGLFN